MNLHQYLLAIQSNKAIKLSAFTRVLAKHYPGNWRNIFSYVNTADNKQRLTVVNNIEFAQLLQKTQPSDNRVSAAKQGDSHQVNASMSYLLVYPDVNVSAINVQTVDNKSCPHVVVCHASGVNMEFKAQRSLVIIENQENYFRYQAFLPQLLANNTDFSSQLPTKVDIAFGQGNNVTNALNATLFEQYQQILCCFDYDLGGLSMFLSLSQLTKTPVVFIQPSTQQLTCGDYVKRHFKKSPKTAAQWQKAIKLAKQLDFIALAQAFNTSKKFMEQEMLLPLPAPVSKQKYEQ